MNPSSTSPDASRSLHGSRDSSRSRKHAWHGVQAAQGAELAPHRRLSGAKGLIRARFERNRSDELLEKRKKEVLGGFLGARAKARGGTMNSIAELLKDENPI